MFNEQQNNIIIGLLLGDGHLRRKEKWNASLEVQRCTRDIEYSAYHVKIFNKYVTEKGLSTKFCYDKRTTKTYYCCNFSLGANEELSTYHDKWYNNGIKVVPNDLILNSEIIATWFCDDGCITKSKNDYFYISLATNGFSKDNIEFLQKLLSDRYSERIRISKAKNSFILQLSDYAARKMIKDMDPFFPEGMERKRKWKNVEFPKLHSSILESSENNRFKTKEFLKTHNEFYLKEFTQYLDLYFVRSSGLIELDVQNAKRYLKKYIDENILIELPRIGINYQKGIKFQKL